MAELNADIMTLIENRMTLGRANYGHGLKADSGYDWIKEALEEALDLSIYLSARLVELQRREARPSIPTGSCEYCPECVNLFVEKTITGKMRCSRCKHEWFADAPVSSGEAF